MAKKVLKATLSVSSLQKLQAELEKYKDNITYKCQLLAERLAEKGVEIAKMRISELDAIFTGELIQSVHTRSGETTDNGAIFYVVADSRHAIFVEFGTGQLGAEGGYPYPFSEGIEWNYNAGKTIFEISPGQYGWFYPGKDGKWYFTQGMPSRPFMYETAMELRQIVEQTAKEVFGK